MRARKQRVAILPVVLALGLAGWLLPATAASALDAPTISAIDGGPAPDAMTISWTTVTGATSYSYSYSTNSGATYSGKMSLGTTSPRTVAVRTGCRYGDASHGSACLFRVYAKSGAIYSAPSTAVGPITWGTDAPTAPVSFKAKATSGADTTVTASWKAPTDTGGLPVTSYTVEVSNDGGSYSEVPWSPLSARTFTETSTGTCEGNATCQYRAFATTDNGDSAASTVSTIAIKPPGKVTALTFADTDDLDPDASDGAAGVTPIGLSWTAPTKGIVTGYEWQIRQLTTSATGVRTLGDWSDSTDVGTTSLSTTCPVSSTTCYLRVRAYTHRDTDTAAVFGPWVTVDDRPWAPYSLGGGVGHDLTSDRTYGGTQTIDIEVYGPAEGGPGPKTSDVKSYEVQACDAVTTDCSVNGDWTTVATDLVYPTARTATVDVSGPCAVDADACSIRVRLVDVVASASGAFGVGTYDGLWSIVETAAGT
jgi:hypothetical protein